MSDHRLACIYHIHKTTTIFREQNWTLGKYFKLFFDNKIVYLFYCLGRNKNEWHVGKYKIRKISRDVGCSK